MPDRQAKIEIVRFNAGKLSKLALARTDLKRMPFSAEQQENFMPRSLGSMMLRPGLRKVVQPYANNRPYGIPFIFSKTDNALMEFTNLFMVPIIDEVKLSRPAVSTAVTNGNFDTDLTGWTDADETGTTSAWAAGGYMSLIGDSFNSAIRTQQVTVAGADQNVEHALRIVVDFGSVRLRVGTTSGDDSYIEETTLSEGTHSLAFTPTGNFWIYVANRAKTASLVASINIEGSGVNALPTPYSTANLKYLRFKQSKNTVYVTARGYQPMQVERRAARSWSFVKYLPADGPFLAPNLTTVTIASSDITGNVTLTASKDLFRPGHVGGLWSISSRGQLVEAEFSSDNAFSDHIIVSGTGTARNFVVNRAGTWSATITLQRSFDEGGSWTDFTTYTTNASTTVNDGLTSVVWYRLGIKTGNYTSGTAATSLDYSGGSITGVVRITGYTSRTSVAAAVLIPLGGTVGTSEWAEGQWSDYRGWPTANTIHESRETFTGQSLVAASVTDNFTSFSTDVEGDSGPIIKRMSGASEYPHWMLSLQRLAIGTDDGVSFMVSSSLDEALSPTNSNLKMPSTQPAGDVDAVQLDDTAIYVQGGGERVHQIGYNSTTLSFASEDLTLFVPEIGEGGFVRIGVQRQPDTRVHCVRADGTAAVLIYEKLEELKCWVDVATPGGDGFIEDVVVLPGSSEDAVYYAVCRTIDGNTVRYWERWATERTASPGGTYIYDSTTAKSTFTRLKYPNGTVVTVRDEDGEKIGNYTVTLGSITLGAPVTYCTITPALYLLGDSYITYSGAATTTITGLDHLEGEKVVVFADGLDVGTVEGGGGSEDDLIYTVTGGQIELATAAEQVMVGLYYEAVYESAKYAVPGILGAGLGQDKDIGAVSILLANTHQGGLLYGPTLEDDDMDALPGTEDDEDINPNHIWPDFDFDDFKFDGETSSDPRICLKAFAPRACTVLGMVPSMRITD